MSEFKISCPNCQQHVLCDESYRGVKFPCPTCGTTIAIPPVAGSAPASGLQVDSTGAGLPAPGELHPRIPGRPHVPIRSAGKSWLTTFLLAWFLGGFGVDRIYNGRIGLGIGKFVTGGALGFWSLIDVILLLARKYQDGKGNYLQPSKRGHMVTALVVMATTLLLAVVVIGAAVRGITSEFDRLAKSEFAKIGSPAGHSGPGFASPEAVFEAMKTSPPATSSDLILVLPPEERYGMAYFSFLTARMAVIFQTDARRKQEAEKDFTTLIEKYRLTDKLEINAGISEEQIKAMAAKAFADVDLSAFANDVDAFNKKYESEIFKTGEASDDPKMVSLKDLKIEGDEAKGTALYTDDTEKPIVFVKSGGSWFYSQERTDRTSSGGVNGSDGGKDGLVLIITFDSEASMSRATKEQLLQGVAYDRSEPATLELDGSGRREATLSFRLSASADKEAIIRTIRRSPGVTKVDNLTNDEMKAVMAGLFEEAFNKAVGKTNVETAPALAEARKRTRRISCANNLKQVGLCFRVWADDHGDQFPFNVPAAKGGTLENCERTADGFDTSAFRHFQALSNELMVAKLLICPGDTSTKPATDWESLNSSNISYLLRTGTQIAKQNPREVLVRCPIDGNTLYCDGSVFQQDGKQDLPPSTTRSGHVQQHEQIKSAKPAEIPPVEAERDDLFSLDKASVPASGSIKVTFSSTMRSPQEQKHWITIIDTKLGDSSSGKWKYVPDGAKDMTLTAPNQSGDYEVRLYSNYTKKSFHVVQRTKLKIESAASSSNEVVLKFDGTNDWLELPPIDWNKLNAFTVEAWVRDWRGGILSQGNAGDPENSLYLGLARSLNNTRNQPTGWESNGRNIEFAIGGVPSDQWIHVAMVFDGKEQAVFINGQQKRRVASPRPGPFDMRRKLIIGRGGEGTFRSTRVSSTARYQGDFRPSTRWKTDSRTLLLLEAENREGKMVQDLSSNKHHANIHGTPMYGGDSK